MSDESALGREPIELVEILLPKCVNTFGSAPCTATGRKCFNTRATCGDPANYRDTPDRHLDPDLNLLNGETIDSDDLTRTASLFAAFEVRFGTDPDGIIWEQGPLSPSIYLGVDSGNLILDARNGTGLISVDASQFAGQTHTLYVEIDFTPSSTSTIRLWRFCHCQLNLVLLGEDDFAASTVWTASGDDGAIGTASGDVASGYPATDWNGAITAARFYDAQSAPAMPVGNGEFNSKLWLGRGVKGEPTDEVKILPCLDRLGSIGTRLNLNGVDDDYEPLGRRATLDFTCSDFTHSDIGQDPYLSDRGYDPFQQSTFWRKWYERQRFGKVGATVRVHDGYAGQKLSSFLKREYILDKVEMSEDAIAFHCRDVLSRTEFRKAQIPAPSSGVLDADVTDVATTFTVTGDVTGDYPATGTVRINDEILTYSARSYSASPNETEFTIDARGTDGSTADDHDAGDLVQLCRRYTAAPVDEVLTEWLADDAEIEGQLINLSELESEATDYLDAYTITTLLTEPGGVSRLVGKLIEETSMLTWWDEREQIIRFKAIRATDSADVVFEWTNEQHIVAGSFKLIEKPKQRLNIVQFYYNPIDFAGDLTKAANFANALLTVNGFSSAPEQYGNVIQTKEIYSRFLTTEAMALQTSSRLSTRYADVPKVATLYVDAKDRSVWVGDIGTISHPDVTDSYGNRLVKRWMVIEAEEVEPGHLVRYVVSDITLDGTIYRITENSLGGSGAADYDEELFLENNAFITDNDGNNPDGSVGARIT